VSRAPALYLITDRKLSQRPLAERVAAALNGVGARATVQLREKDLSARELLELGRSVLAACRAHGARLLINDRIDVALALGADGVHLGSGSLPASEARRLLGPKALIGVSCHSAAELSERRDGADFSTWGPVFPTASKAKYGPPVGFSGIEKALELGVPLVGLGGLRPENAGSLRAHGISGVACIGAVFGAQEPGAAARALLEAFEARSTR
jgi:thiamine-phosphate pyrophosphorylase